jgi:hypothetical protein
MDGRDWVVTYLSAGLDLVRRSVDGRQRGDPAVLKACR